MMKVSKFISQLIPYVPGKPIEETKRQYNIREVHKLASNENPLGPSPMALEAIKSALDQLHLYPDASAYELKKKFSQFLNVPEDYLAFGNGSDELVDILVRIYCDAGDKILTSHRAFDTYRLSAQVCRCETTYVPMAMDFKFDLAGFANAWTPQHKVIFITNPNNPTGTYSTKSEVEVLLKKFGGSEEVIIVIDEAYYEFVRAEDFPSAVELALRFKNIVALRTLSKAYGLAGLRLGLMVAHPETTSLVNKVRKPFNVNSLVQIAACAALDDQVFVKKTKTLTWETLDYFYSEFDRMGLDYLPSQGNFILVDMGKTAYPIYEKLLSRGLIVRPLGAYDLPTFLRISVGLPHQNEILIKALKECI